jgi:hypothetical protein
VIYGELGQWEPRPGFRLENPGEIGQKEGGHISLFVSEDGAITLTAYDSIDEENPAFEVGLTRRLLLAALSVSRIADGATE